MSLRRLAVVGILMELCYVSFYFCADGPAEVLLFIAVNVTTYLLLSWLVYRISKNPPAAERMRTMVTLTVAFGLLFRLTLVPHAVVGSDDIFRYLWDGKVAASGVNPFAYLPTDPRLTHLATPDLPSKVNHPDMRTIYPPLAQGFFWIAHVLCGDSVTGLKFLLVVMDCLTIAILWALLRRRGDSPHRILLYAWSPLPILYFGLDGHIDALGIPFLVLFLLFVGTDRPVRGAIALGFGILAKLYPLLVVPMLLQINTGIRRFLLPAIPLLMVALGYMLYFEPTWGVIEALRTFSARWEFNGGVFYLLHRLVESNETAHLISGVITACCIGILVFLDRPLLEKVFWGFVSFIFLSPVVHPWYLTWLAVLLPLRWSTPVFVFLGLSAAANVVVYQYRAYGLWNDQPLLIAIEYIPIAVLFVWEIFRRRKVQPVRETPGDPIV